MLKFPPTSRHDIIRLCILAGGLVLCLLGTGAVAVARHGLDTQGAISASCYGLGLLIVGYGLLWGRQHAKLIYLLAFIAFQVGLLPNVSRAWP